MRLHYLYYSRKNDPDTLNFVSVFDGPATACTCPNGSIICAHLGGLLAKCYAIVQAYKRLEEAAKSKEHGDSDDNDDSDIILFKDLKVYFPEAVHGLVQQPIPTSFCFPAPGSKPKLETNMYRNQKNMNKRKKGRRGNSSRGQGRGRGNSRRSGGQFRSCDGGRGHNGRSDSSTKDTETEIDAFDVMDDLREYVEEEAASHEVYEAIPGIIDNSITPTVPVIQRINEWILCILDGRNEIGKESIRKEMIQEHIKNMADLKSSDLYVARQLKFLAALEGCIERKRSRDTDRAGEEPVQNEPILANVLESTKRKRGQICNEMKGKFDEAQLCLSVTTEKDW
mmetsp:Transcript_4921/g.5443  ORF Transcript_4921/g.5443 Transcript_4921/m.5443 type:complete len:339 (-) Transcript_4921:320-1336(-)